MRHLLLTIIFTLTATAYGHASEQFPIEVTLDKASTTPFTYSACVPDGN
jgi:hypothetical protein